MVNDSRDRGQIMLIGAIAIAFIVLGLVAVYSAQLTARPATTGSVGDSTAEATELNREARRNARAITIRVNHDQPYYASRAALNASVDDAVANYSGLMAETYAGSRGAAATVRYDGAARMGTRTVRHSDGPMGGASPWHPVDQPSDLGWFVFNFNLSAMDKGESFVVRVENGTGADPPDTTYTFTRNTTGSSVLSVEVDSETGATILGRGTCNPVGNRSVIDLTTGESFTSSCAFGPGIDRLTGPYTVTFEQGDNAVGKFGIVTDTRPTNWGALNARPDCTGGTEPCNTYAAWNVTITTGYESGALSYENTQNVTVYRGA
ncbi:hypothetical protein ACOZ4L_02605 [Haloplanus ruber]|uniref:Flagellin n=1 Tax=Haloplanus ruber TaxID=869892 RepID=A0ABD6CZV6_9EURY|nr:hypothetical protein [Haloplanus ruber]